MQAVLLDKDTLWPSDLELSKLLSRPASWQVYPLTPPELTVQRIAQAEIVVTNKVVIDAHILSRAENLRLVVVAATGTDNIDLGAAAEKGVTVCNIPGYGVASVAQHTMALMLALATRLVEYSNDVRNGCWQQSDQFCLLGHPITELAGKTLGIVGYGTLGREVARLARAFGMEVMVGESHAAVLTETAKRVSLDQLFCESDVISLHCLLSDHTRHLINEQRIRQMKPSALLINAARGGLIDEPALLRGLVEGEIAGAALDVLGQEPPLGDNPLISARLANLIITPHCAWGSREARQRLVDIVATNIHGFLDGSPTNQVN